MAGVSDLFLVNTQSPLAQLYNNISVNENHHCACVWKMLSQPELNITENLASEQWRELRSLVVKMFMGAIRNSYAALRLLRMPMLRMADRPPGKLPLSA